jgi:hypothetical protein
MKKLSLRFRKSNGANYFLFSSLSLLTLIVGCSRRIDTNHASLSSEDPAKAAMPLITVAESVKQSWVEVRSNALPVMASHVRMGAKSCVERKFVFSSTLVVLGQSFDMVFEEEAGLLTLGIVEDSETKLSGFELGQEVKDALCKGPSQSSDGVLLLDNQLHAKLVSVVSAAMQKMVPDCKSVAFDARSVQCRLEQLLPQPALVKTEEFQKAMIRKWSRQPYILARRTGVVSTLARSAINLGRDDGFTKFCKVLQFSLPEELPVVMTSRRWQNALCSGQASISREAALYGLSKGVQELAMLRKLYEQTSREGFLSVKIPLQTIPGRAMEASRQPLRVTIAPDSDVSKKLVDEARQYLGRPEVDELPKRLSGRKRAARLRVRHEHLMAKPLMASLTVDRGVMCWHPVFAESWDLMRVADGMKLTGDGFQFECGFMDEREEATKREMASLSRYLLQSLSSETEFVIDNGQSKLLRLPEGRYQYTVHVLPANPLDSEDIEDDNSPKSTGELGWGSSRNHAIKVW